MPRNKSVGRPLLLNESMINRIVELLQKGNYYETVCGVLGISYGVFRQWMIKGEEQVNAYPPDCELQEEEETIFIKLFNAVHQAEKFGEAAMLEKIRTDDTWQSKAWILERRHSSRWAKTQTVNNNTNVNIKGEINHEHALTEQLSKYADIFRDAEEQSTIDTTGSSTDEEER